MNIDWTSGLERRLLIILLVMFTLAATLYSIKTPLFEMSDELWHYPMVKTLADGNGLPLQDPANVGPWRQEGSQPPLYYYLAAAATAWIDTSDVGEVLRPNPHVDNGVITPDGNNNLVVHNYAREAWPWRGAVLAVHIARLLSVIFGAGAIYFTYRIGVEVFPDRRWLALAGAATVGFTPMFTFISGAVNNDSLSVMLAAASLWIMMQIIVRAEHRASTLGWAVILGTVLGLAALAKTSTLALFGLAGFSTAFAAWRAKRWQTFFVEGSITILVAALISGWWYVRNYRLYGDPLGLNAFIAVLGQRARPASLLQLWGERFGFMQSYWGLFGGVNIPMPARAYDVLNALAILSVVGVLIALLQKWRRDKFDLVAWMPTLLSLLWIVGVVVPLTLSWAQITWSSQGRLVFAAISCISLWFIAGLSAPLPRRIGPVIAGAVLTLLIALTFISPFLWIAPHYNPPAQAAEISGLGIADFAPPGSDDPALRLVDFHVQQDEAHPGESVRVKVTWESLAPMDRNWSIFVHLEDSAQVLAGQRDMYPGQGLIATKEIVVGRRWTDTIVVPVSASAYTPETLHLKVGLYDYTSCPIPCLRMITSNGEDSIELAEVHLTPSNSGGNIPNPISFDFGGEMELVGYSLSTRSLQAGDTFQVKLYWLGLRAMATNYSVSVQLLGSGMQNFGQKDSWPQNGARPTSAWTPSEIVEDEYELTARPDAPPGVYDIQIVVYSVDDTGNFARLQRVMPDGRLVDDFVLLTKLRVLP